ncbi:MAG: two-component system, OmpR family, operon response regulator KdpE [Chloroflexota bacterium]|jgi:two-component system KDP operon response regulator KdpE|nr:two-component system, OmpR family, operon response regulator KdpE [Chloroflexota bacterium]
MKILVADDDQSILDAVTCGFQLCWQDCIVIPASDGNTALRQFAVHDPTLVILDVSMPDPDGYAVLQAIRRSSDVPVIMLTALATDVNQIRGLELGADDYVAKPFKLQVLLARVKNLLRRARALPPTDTQPDFTVGELAINFSSQLVTRAGAPVHLTPLEFRLLHHLTRHPNRLVPQQALLEHVWGTESEAGATSVKAYVSRLRNKLGWNAASDWAIVNERGLGYRFVLHPQRHGAKGGAPLSVLPAGESTRETA